jgi:hypothetical protein
MKVFKYIFVFILLILLIKNCNQKQVKKKTSNIQQTTNVENLEIELFYNHQRSINPNIFGLNTGFIWNKEIDKESDFVELLKESNNVVLRFPGGGVANNYQPDEVGYGYNPLKRPVAKPLIMLYHQTKDRKYNIIENFISLCHQSKAKAIYCANVLDGSVEKMLFVIKKLKSANIDVIGVELGNEFNLGNYRHIFPNADVYLDTILNYIQALRKNYPEIPIGLIAEPLDKNELTDKRSVFMHNWNKTLSKADFDAFVVHHYFPFEDKEKEFDNIYIKSVPIIDKACEDFAPKTIDYFNTLNPDKKIWLTEWNIWNYFAFNTFLQAAFVGQFLNELAKTDTANKINMTCLHDIGGMIYSVNGISNYTYKKNTRAVSTFFFPFQFLSEIVVKQNAKRIEHQLSKNITNFKVYSYFNADLKENYIYFINTSNNKISFSIKNAKSDINLRYILSEELYGHAGNANFTKEYLSKNKLIQYQTKNIEGNNIMLQPYSLGVLRFKN